MRIEPRTGKMREGIQYLLERGREGGRQRGRHRGGAAVVDNIHWRRTSASASTGAGGSHGSGGERGASPAVVVVMVVIRRR
jgi:hypothetical protein